MQGYDVFGLNLARFVSIRKVVASTTKTVLVAPSN